MAFGRPVPKQTGQTSAFCILHSAFKAGGKLTTDHRYATDGLWLDFRIGGASFCIHPPLCGGWRGRKETKGAEAFISRPGRKLLRLLPGDGQIQSLGGGAK